MAETAYYDSPMTGEQLDAAFAQMAEINQSVTRAEQSAETARLYGQTVAENAQAIQNIENNMETILAAPGCAQEAEKSAEQAEASKSDAESFALQAEQDAATAEKAAEQAQQIAQGALGWYVTEQALKSVYPTGKNGQWAIVGSTDTIWTWDSDTYAWKNTSVKTDLSGYYTKEQADAVFLQASGLLDLVYPVGSIYTSTKNVSPKNFLGGTWQAIQGRFLLAADGGTYTAGSTGGEAAHALTEEENGPHTHTVDGGDVPLVGLDHATAGLSSQGIYFYGTRGSISSSGLGTPHNNMPPYLAVYMWQRTA